MTTPSTPPSALDALKALEAAHENFVPPVVDLVEALEKQRGELADGLAKLTILRENWLASVAQEFDPKFAEDHAKADAERARLEKRISDRHDKLIAEGEAATQQVEQNIADLREALSMDLDAVDEQLAAIAPVPLSTQPSAGRQSRRRTNDKSTDVRPPGRVRRAARSVRQFVTVEEPPNNPQSASEPKGKK